MTNRLHRIFVATALLGSMAIGFHSARGQQPPHHPTGMPPEATTPPPADYSQQMQVNPAMPANDAPSTNVIMPNPQNMGDPAPMYVPQAQPGLQPPPHMQAPSNQQVEAKPSIVETILPPPRSGTETSALLKTSMGDITIRLFTAQSPVTAKNFIDLARGEKEFVDVKTGKKVKRPFYNGLIFHRVLKGFLIQTGCPYGTGRGGPGYTTRSETSPNLKFNKPGIVAMAPPRNSKGDLERDSNGSQFFITLTPQPELDDRATIFGEVTKGMDVITKIAAVRTGPTDRPVRRVYLLSVEIFEGSQQESAPVDNPVSDAAAAPQE